MAVKQTAGRDALGEFAPKIAEVVTHAAFYCGWPKAWAVFRMAKDIWGEE